MKTRVTLRKKIPAQLRFRGMDMRLLLLMFLFSAFALQSVAQTDCKTMHKVAKKETIYGIAHQYGITQAELIAANPLLAEKGLKKGQTLCIPYSSAEIEAARQEAEAQAEAERAAQVQYFTTIKVAVILPFALNKTKPTEEAQKMLDFYEGILLTADSLKKAGVNLDLLVLDEGSSDASAVQQALQHSALPAVNLIIGPGRTASVNAVAAFAQQHQIPLVIPFASSENIIGGRPYVLQCNTGHATHYQKVVNRIAARHSSDNIIFVDMTEKPGTDAYIGDLIKVLDAKGIGHSRIALADMDEKLADMMAASKNNLFIPTSSAAGCFDMLCLKLNDLNVAATHKVQLIGSPEWQTLSSKSQKNMYKYSATYFATFFTNTLSSRTQKFCRDFEQSFGHQQVGSYPRYGEMGHDISAFFLTAMQRYGNRFLDHIQQHDFNSLQLPLHFVRKDEQSGYANTATYVIYYKPEGDVILTTF